MKKSDIFVISLALTLFSGTADAKENYSQSEGVLQYVDPYIGSGGHGNVFLGTSVPFGAVQVGPTNIHRGWDWCSGYQYSDSVLIGFSQTHLTGTGASDLCDVLLMPMNEINIERGDFDNMDGTYASFYSHDNEVARPEYYSLLLDKYNIKAEMTATDRVGFYRFTYPDGKPASLMVDLSEGNWSKAFESYIRQVNDNTIEGYVITRGFSPNRKLYFVLNTNQKIQKFTPYEKDVAKVTDQLRSDKVKGVLEFGNISNLKVKVAVSSVSCDNAALNLSTELPHWNFDTVVNDNSKRWNKELSKINVETSDFAGKRTFYTAYYHTMIAPYLYCDVNGEYRGVNDMIYTDPNKANYTTLSLWDTYRAYHPLMTVIQPEKVPGFINTMLSIYNQQDKLPIWPLMCGETNLMPGYSAVPVVADAILKGFDGFDKEKAYKALKASATYEKQRGLPFVMERGYIPADKQKEGTSIAMEYAVDDWGVAAVARKMGKLEDAELFGKRALYYKNYFDPTIGYIRPKLDDGSWRTPYSPTEAVHAVGDFCEGNGWQYTFFAPQDPYGLIEMLGGDKVFTARLDEFFKCNADMGEKASKDISGLIGQYAHGNEPSHHIAYLYAYAGDQWKTAAIVRKVMKDFYTDKVDGIIGNEDAGQMSAWYLLSSMGLYQVNPSDGVFVFGSPRYEKISVSVRDGKTFTVEAKNNSDDNIYIQKAYLNGKPYEKTYVTYDDIMNGCHLTFVSGKKPNKNFGKKVENRPIILNQ